MQYLTEYTELIRIIYGILVGLTCLTIVLKTDRLFRISQHKGIRYFRNAFLFYGLGFIIRYSIGGFFSYLGIKFVSSVLLFEFFLIMGGFFLIYSLLWKKIETEKTNYKSSLFNSRIFLFYIMAFILAVLDYLIKEHYLLFLSQIILFGFASIISYNNYIKKGEKHKFLKFYFLAMILSFVAWVINAVAVLYLEMYGSSVLDLYLDETLNILVFMLITYGVVKLTKR